MKSALDRGLASACSVSGGQAATKTVFSETSGMGGLLISSLHTLSTTVVKLGDYGSCLPFLPSLILQCT